MQTLASPPTGYYSLLTILDDIVIVMDLLRRVRPHEVYAAGDLSDPHGTHRTCLDAIVRACRIRRAVSRASGRERRSRAG